MERLSFPVEWINLQLEHGMTAPLPPKIADLLKKRVRLGTAFGSTELVRVAGEDIGEENQEDTRQETDVEDHEYIRIEASQMGVEWREVATGRYEMVHVRVKPGPEANNLIQPQYVFLSYPDLGEYSSGDLFSKHPRKSGYWKYEGRKDHSIVLSIGQNVIPRAFEERLEKHPAVRSATVLGNGRPCVCLLLELEEEYWEVGCLDCTPGTKLAREIWSVIQRASEGMRTYEQVPRSMVILASRDKPIPRSFKGEVKRREACEVYKDEIEARYKTQDVSPNRAYG